MVTVIRHHHNLVKCECIVIAYQKKQMDIMARISVERANRPSNGAMTTTVNWLEDPARQNTQTTYHRHTINQVHKHMPEIVNFVSHAVCNIVSAGDPLAPDKPPNNNTQWTVKKCEEGFRQVTNYLGNALINVA